MRKDKRTHLEIPSIRTLQWQTSRSTEISQCIKEWRSFTITLPPINNDQLEFDMIIKEIMLPLNKYKTGSR